MNERNVEGGCYCGEVRYRFRGAPLHSTVCHCVDCRRAAGAQSVAWVTAPAAAFGWTKGEPARFRSSPPVERTFCGRCGASLTYTHSRRANDIDITTATLDDPEAFPPTKDVFAEQKLSWTR
jgi:hypothetical protein